MKKYLPALIIFILLVCFCLTAHASDLNIKFESNKIVGTLRFMYRLADIGNGSDLIKKLYLDKRKNQNQDKTHIEKVKKIFSDLPSSFQLLPSSPSWYFRSKQLTSVIYYYASVAKDPNDFKFLIYSILPDSYANELIESLDYFLPIYDEIYYNPGLKELNELLDEYNASIPSYNTILTKIETFYKPELMNKDIRIIFVPLYMTKDDFVKYKGKIVTRGESLGKLQIIEILISDDKDLKAKYAKASKTQNWDVALHEMIHYFQSISAIKGINQTIKNYDPDTGKICLNYLNEGIATAIGNGYNGIKSGTADFKDSWYNDPIIDTYAKDLYPMVEKYLTGDKTIDNDFAIEAAKIFKAKFKEANKIPQVVFNKIHVISDSFDGKQVSLIIRKHFNPNDEFRSSPINHAKTLDNFSKLIEVNQIFVINSDEFKELKSYNLTCMEKLTGLALNNKNFIYNFYDTQLNRYSIFFICEDNEKFEKLLDKISNQPILDEELILLP